MSERLVRNEAEVFIQRRLVEVRLQELQSLRQLSGRTPEQTRADEECSAKFLADALADWEKLIGRAQKEAEEAAEELGRGAERAWQRAKNFAPSQRWAHLERERIWNGFGTGTGTDKNPFPFFEAISEWEQERIWNG